MKNITEIIPVIHMVNHNQVMTNVDTCITCGIEKVFLINHQVSSEELIKCGLHVKEKYPKLWVGVNMLDKYAEDAIMYEFNFDGLWCDQTIEAHSIMDRRFTGMLFTGLAFKYQPQPKDLKDACELAKITSDVATTSGPGTGKEANIEKILELRNLLGNHPLAIASGVNKDNIKSYKGIANYLLVASSITSRSEIIEADKLITLINTLNDNIQKRRDRS